MSNCVVFTFMQVDVPDMLEWKSSVLDEAERNLKLGVSFFNEWVNINFCL